MPLIPHYLIEQNNLIVQNPFHLNYIEWLGAYHFPMALETGVNWRGEQLIGKERP